MKVKNDEKGDGVDLPWFAWVRGCGRRRRSRALFGIPLGRGRAAGFLATCDGSHGLGATITGGDGEDCPKVR